MDATFPTEMGLVALINGSEHLRDEVLAKLLNRDIVSGLYGAGLNLEALSVKAVSGGKLAVSYHVYVTPEMLATMPSVYDDVPKKKGGKK